MLHQLEQTMSKDEIEEGEKYNILICLEDIKDRAEVMIEEIKGNNNE